MQVVEEEVAARALLARHQGQAGEIAEPGDAPGVAGRHDQALYPPGPFDQHDRHAGHGALDVTPVPVLGLGLVDVQAGGDRLAGGEPASPSRLPSKNAASSLPDSRSAHSSKGSWLPAITGGRPCRPSMPPPYSACCQTQASTIARGNRSLPVTRLTGIACAATSSYTLRSLIRSRAATSLVVRNSGMAAVMHELGAYAYAPSQPEGGGAHADDAAEDMSKVQPLPCSG